jgi:hypothetical protein
MGQIGATSDAQNPVVFRIETMLKEREEADLERGPASWSSTMR